MRILRVLTGFAVIVLLVVGGMFLLLYTEDVVSTYATYEEAERDGAHRRGWMPAYVPRSAQEIREVHNIDSNRQWLRFRLPEADARAMVRKMQPLSYAEARTSARKPPRWRGPWIPKLERATLLSPRGDLSLLHDAAPGLGARCVAVEWNEPAAVYAWSC